MECGILYIEKTNVIAFDKRMFCRIIDVLSDRQRFSMMEYDKKAVGEAIRERRIALGFTQQQAAEVAKISLRFYQRIESGNVGMSVDSMLRICDLMETTPDGLLLKVLPGETQSEMAWITEKLLHYPQKTQSTAIELMKVFLGFLE